MVLGLGSRSSRKEAKAPPPPLQVAEVEVRLHFIKPWQRSYCGQSESSVVLRWSRDEKTFGSSRAMASVQDDDCENRGIAAEKLVVGESFRASMASTEGSNDQRKSKKSMAMAMRMRKKKSVAVLESPFVFHLFHCDDLKQSLAQATLDLTAIALVPDSPSSIALPFTFFKPASKGISAYLHLSVLLRPNPNQSSAAAAKVMMKLRSDAEMARPMPPLDPETQRALVEALLSDEDEEDEVSIASWTEDEEGEEGVSKRTGGAMIVESEEVNNGMKTKQTTVERQQSAELKTLTQRQSAELKPLITPLFPRLFSSFTRDASSSLGNNGKPLHADTPPHNASDAAQNQSTVGLSHYDSSKNPSFRTNSSLPSSTAGTNPVMSTVTGTNAQDPNTTILPKQNSLEPRIVLKEHRRELLQGFSSQRFAISEDKYHRKNINGWSPERTKRMAAAQASGSVSMSLRKEGKGKVSNSMDAGLDKRKQQLEYEVDNLRGELSDVAALESAIYSTAAEHSCSSFKLHAPARRLARTYEHTHKYCSRERRAQCARNIVTGLVIAARACANDVPRLTFWWSNAVLLREIISRTFNVFLPKADTPVSMYSETKKPQTMNGITDTWHQQQKPNPCNQPNFDDWIEPSTLMAALERLEGWIYTKVLELIWWQVFTPQMQKQVSYSSSHLHGNGDDDGIEEKSSGFEFGDDKQGSVWVEIWKKAFIEACDKLCPVQRLAVKCGCLPMLKKTVIEACVVRLDVAVFNAVLRDNEPPTDPISDPISDARVLPIPTRNLSFGVGAQLKNSVASLSTWLINAILKENDDTVTNTLEDDEKARMLFPLLKAIGGVLMIPKDMLLDESLREEVCPLLSVSEIVKMLSRFRPDEFSPEPVTAELLHAMSSGVEEMHDTMRLAAPLMYSSPDSGMVRHVITEILGGGNNSKGAAKKGHTSDDEVDELGSSIRWLLENTEGGSAGKGGKKIGTRFELLSGIWSGKNE